MSEVMERFIVDDWITRQEFSQYKECLSNHLNWTKMVSIMRTKYGFVVLIDALGTKTDSIDASKKYLESVAQIKDDIRRSHKVAADTRIKKEPNVLKNLKTRFFGDTLLLTYEIKDKSREGENFEELAFILRWFLLNALRLRILFRGSISLGKYLEGGNIVLGPAVFDAAAWYDKLEMIGIIATPRATISLRSIFLEQMEETNGKGYWSDGIFYTVPLKGLTPRELYAINWPVCLHSEAESTNTTTNVLFYELMRDFPMPFGTEIKFQNTERFFLDLYQSEEWKEWDSIVKEGEKET